MLVLSQDLFALVLGVGVGAHEWSPPSPDGKTDDSKVKNRRNPSRRFRDRIIISQPRPTKRNRWSRGGARLGTAYLPENATTPTSRKLV